MVNDGYEIHAGDTVPTGDYMPMNRLEDGSNDGCVVDENCMGTYIHGILDNKEIVDYLIRPYIGNSDISDLPNYREYKEQQYNLLAERMREYVNIPRLYEIMGGNHD